MKWIIAADLHGSAYYCRELCRLFREEGGERLLLLGDLLYHGPRNDLPRDYEPKAVINLLNGLKENIVAVRGNCEAEVDQAVLDFPVLASYAYICDGAVTVFATHGHRYNEHNVPPLARGTILLNGHTHVPKCVVHERYVYMNPGSLSLPKEGSRHGYLVWDGAVFTWKDTDGASIMTYHAGQAE
ncbi:phosphodiesterase [Megasphaera vaginalis (ex Srinivasan et al. 2021)]|uniref:Phosphodiesterase family protein n=1 Tax=Megasphaera vaginalis (ex Srinivasan et al. 2021) TaxID=1111454 RepID=U7ULI2_9FIRM|nr:phosphodiesterase [Megasphaera vaginalis (ex Srinivasan et al. 2021)]ERT60282.1 phosphodiesterase family protein [Megasphaera vaginalis (ex Srinivasan et al. 2021)]